jgi:hypothetical protein
MTYEHKSYIFSVNWWSTVKIQFKTMTNPISSKILHTNVPFQDLCLSRRWLGRVRYYILRCDTLYVLLKIFLVFWSYLLSTSAGQKTAPKLWSISTILYGTLYQKTVILSYLILTTGSLVSGCGTPPFLVPAGQSVWRLGHSLDITRTMVLFSSAQRIISVVVSNQTKL